MSKTVMIQRAKAAPSCQIWDGRFARPGVPIAVEVENAADLLERDPDDWSIPAAAEAGLVKAEIKRRADAAKAAADAAAKASAGGGV